MFWSWIAFIGASTALIVSPGPTFLVVISNALSEGRRAILPNMLGVAAADLILMTLSVIGVGSLVAAAPSLLWAIKIAGAVYLAWLGVTLVRARAFSVRAQTEQTGLSARTMWARCFWTTVLNPKGLVFFFAFLPQFYVQGLPLWQQLGLLVATFIVLSASGVALWSLFASRLAGTTSAWILTAQRATGAALMLVALGTLLSGWFW